MEHFEWPPGNTSFAKSLYRLEIGTPVHSAIPQSLSTRNWLAANLRSQIQRAQEIDRPSSLAQELVGLLQPEDTQSLARSFGAKHLIIIKSVAESNPAVHTDAAR